MSVLPDWPSVGPVVAELRGRPGLVGMADCAALRRQLAGVAAGTAVVVQGGDCAELFAEVSVTGTRRKAAQLHDLAGIVAAGAGLPAVRIGRLAGQFAKPRSAATEVGPDGVEVPVYRGDAVNGLAATVAARTPDPRRLLAAYDASARVLAHLPPGIYTSHEALLPDYEQPLIRRDPETGLRYGTSAHLLWAGHRTRQAHGPHIDLLAGIANPVAVKIGPGATPDDLAALIERLDPAREPGRLTFIARFGADRVMESLPSLVDTAARAGVRPVWLCDPMHGNTLVTSTGRKTRAVSDVAAEVAAFVAILRAAGVHPGGLHLELTPDEVTECVDDRSEAAGAPALPRYRTACDPRLNAHQARRVAAIFAAATARASSAAQR